MISIQAKSSTNISADGELLAFVSNLVSTARINYFPMFKMLKSVSLAQTVTNKHTHHSLDQCTPEYFALVKDIFPTHRKSLSYEESGLCKSELCIFLDIKIN